MGFLTFLFGPSKIEVYKSEVPIHFQSSEVAGGMMGAVISQRGALSEEQLEQFKEIAKNAEDNAKRIKIAMEVIKKVDSAETEVTKEVFNALNTLEKNSFKRAEYQKTREREHRLIQEKFHSLRKGL